MRRSFLGLGVVFLFLFIQVAGSASAPGPDYYPLCASPQPIAPMQAAGGTALYLGSAVAWNGQDYAVVWVDAVDNRLYFRRFFADGTPAAAKVVNTLYSYASYPASITWNGSGYGVAWTAWSGSYWQVYFSRLDAAGTPIGSPVKVSFSAGGDSVDSYTGALATSGNGYAVVWYDGRNGNNDIFATLLDASGSIAYHDIAISTAASSQDSPVVAWSGAVNRYQIAWEDSRSGTKYELWGSQLSAGGVWSSNTSLVSGSSNATEPSLESAGSNLGLAWYDHRDGNYEIYFARLAADGYKIGSDLRLSNNTASSFYPKVTWTGAEYGVFWSDDRGGTYETWFQRVTAAGATAGVNIQETFSGPMLYPNAAFGRYGYLATSTYANIAYGGNFVSAWGCAADSTPPTCPVNLVAYGVTGTTATIAWIPSVEDATDIAYYEVYRNSALVARTSDNFYADSGLGLNTTYNYYVRPVNAAQLVNGICTSSSSIYVKTNATLILMVDKSAPDAVLSWNDASMNNYNVFRGTSPQVMTQVGATDTLSFNDPNVLMDSNLYFYTVDEPGW